MILQGAGGQQKQTFLYAADITMTGSAQLVLARSLSRSSLILQNLSAANSMFIEIGGARATATLSSGTVSSVAVTNAGFNYTKAPVVRFLGGGYPGGSSKSPLYNSSYLGLGQPNAPSPSHFAVAHAVLTGGAVSSIVVDDPGSEYAIAPYVQLISSDLDPYGCALPAISGPVGMELFINTPPTSWNGTTCPTDAISVVGVEGDVLLCRWAE